MIDYEYFDLFWQNSLPKKVKIEFDGAVLTNEDLYNQEMSLEESLCSESELRFGCCEASILQFKISDIFSQMHGKWLNVKLTLEEHEDKPFLIGKYKVDSDSLDSERKYREVIAYDAMYDIINTDVSAWYNSVLPEENSSMTLKQFRESFVRYFGLTEIVPGESLVNDNMTVKRTIDPEQISGLDVITAICEINGCFGHIGRDGKFHYIYLPQAVEGLYPANDLYPDHAPEWMAQAKTGHLYPQDPKSTNIEVGTKITCTYKNFRAKSITKLQIRQSENEIGRVWPNGDILETDNCYIIQDNFLVYGKSHDELTTIASNIFGKIKDIIYRPFESYCVGNPCLEVGDAVRLVTTHDIVESYILKRTIKGIQSLRDTYKADGVEKYSEQVNGINSSIIQLKGKTNILERTVNETRLEMANIESGLKTEISVTAAGLQANITSEKNRAEGAELNLSNSISVTASGLQAEITRAEGAEASLSNSISVTASGLQAEITRAEGAELNLSNSISVTASGLQANITAEKNRAEGEETKLSNRINVTSEGLNAEITRASGAENTLSARIDVNAQEINLRMTAGDVQSLIQQSASSIRLQAEKISWSSAYSSMTENGILKCQSAQISGTLQTGYYGSGYWIYLDSYGKINGGLGTRQYGYIDFSADLINPEHPDDPDYHYYGIQMQGGIVRISAPIISVGRSTDINEFTYNGGNGTITVGDKTIRFINGIMVTIL